MQQTTTNSYAHFDDTPPAATEIDPLYLLRFAQPERDLWFTSQALNKVAHLQLQPDLCLLDGKVASRRRRNKRNRREQEKFVNRSRANGQISLILENRNRFVND